MWVRTALMYSRRQQRKSLQLGNPGEQHDAYPGFDLVVAHSPPLRDLSGDEEAGVAGLDADPLYRRATIGASINDWTQTYLGYRRRRISGVLPLRATPR